MIEKPDPRLPLTSPCPCGSGRKYKRCCWPKEKRRAAEARTAIQRVTPQVGAYAAGFEEELSEFQKTFFGPLEERFSKEELAKFISRTDEAVKVVFFDILAADYVMRNGRTPVEMFLDDPKASGDLHPTAREYVEAWGRESIGLFEVQDVVPGRSLVLKDLLARRSIKVLEKSASQSLRKWNVIFTRVARMGEAGLITGPVLEVPRHMLQWLVDGLKTAKEEPGNKSVTWARFFKKHWDLIPYLWFLMWMAPFEGMEFQNFDGDELHNISVTYKLVAGGGIGARERLDSTEELSGEDHGSWIWFEERDRGTLENISVAQVSVDGNSVLVRVNSREREVRVRERIDHVLGDLVVRVDRSDQAMNLDVLRRAEATEKSEETPNAVPLDVQQQVVHQMLANHYRRWLDEPVPALGGLTPRQAVAKRSHRQRVVSLLKDIEIGAARQNPDEPGAGFDFRWLWNELGLPRP